jgi:hypothetical protein
MYFSLIILPNFSLGILINSAKLILAKAIQAFLKFSHYAGNLEYRHFLRKTYYLVIVGLFYEE